MLKFVYTIFLLAVLSSDSFPEGPWKFVVTCDSRGHTSGINRRILEELAAEIKDRGVDFVLFPGDLVSGLTAANASEFEAQLKRWVKIMEPVYDADISVYVCRGNHELGDVWSTYPYPGGEPNPTDNYMLRWVNVFGNDSYPKQKLPDNGPPDEKYMTYSFTHKNVFIVVLDQYAGTGHEFAHKINQTWLDAQLAANTKPHVFITGHEAAFRTWHTDCLDYYPTKRDAFWRSIKNAGGRTYFCGHDHFYDHARIDDGDGDPNNDIHQYIIGAAGGPLYSWSPPYDGNNTSFTLEQWYHAKRYGYLLAEIDGLDATLTWMERNSNDLTITGIYQPSDVWSYKVIPKPIVLSPNGGERLIAASSYTITWKTLEGSEIPDVMIEYSSDSGRSWQQISPGWNSGSYKWEPLPVVDSKECLVRISSLYDTTISDTSDDVFTIFQCRRKLAGDLNGDCYVDLLDLAILAGDWLKCANPSDASCD